MKEIDMKWKLRAFWLAVVAAAAYINAVGAYGAEAINGVAFGQTAAAWVQAIGSVAAILVAVWVGDQQAKRNLELQDQLAQSTAQRDLSVVLGLLDVAVVEILEADQAIKTDADEWANEWHDDEQFDGYVAAADAVEAHRLPSYLAVKSVLEIRYRLKAAAENLREIARYPGVQLVEQEYLPYLALNLQCLKEGRDAIAAEITRFGGKPPIAAWLLPQG